MPIEARFAHVGRLRFVYATDPERNVIELQQWSG
jgi:hypothetical protein